MRFSGRVVDLKVCALGKDCGTLLSSPFAALLSGHEVDAFVLSGYRSHQECLFAGDRASSTDHCKMGQAICDQTGYDVLSAGRLVTNNGALVSRGEKIGSWHDCVEEILG